MAQGINIDVNANIAGIQKDLGQAARILTKFEAQAKSASAGVTSAFKAIGAGITISGFAAIIKSNIDLADNLRDLSKSTSITVEDLAGLNLVAKQSGTQLEDVAGAVNKLSVNIGKNADKFTALGITAKAPLEAFAQLADVFVSIEDPQQRAAVAAAALGKSWQETAPLLSEGGAAIRAMVEDGKKFSGITTEMADAADKFNDDMESLKASIGGVGVALTGPVLDGFNQLIGDMRQATETGVTLTNVLQGIINFATQADTSTRGLIQAQRDFVASKIEVMKNQGFIGQLIDDATGQDINLEKNRLESLDKQLRQYDETQQQVIKNQNSIKAPSQSAIQGLIGAGGSGSGKGNEAARALKKAQEDARREAERAQQAYDNAAQSATDYLNQIVESTEIIGKSEKEVALIELDRQANRLAIMGLDQDYIEQFRKIGQEEIAINQERKKAFENLNIRTDVFKELDDTLNTLVDNDKFTDVLTHWKKLMDDGVVSTDEFKTHMKDLAIEFNKSSEAIKNSNDQMSEFAIQAARNMQNAFADFLFDPFQGGVEGMVDNFSTALQRMVANAAAQQIFDSLGIDKFLKSGLQGNGLGDAASSLFSGAADFLSGIFSEKGNVFQGGNVVPFANGGIINSPMMFPLRNNKIGIAGEAGAEAIMPLRRDSSGRLGVAMSGNQGGDTIINITQNFNISNGADGSRIRQSAGQGLRDALAVVNSAGRYR